VGAALGLTIRATGYPAPALAESGPLPHGLTFTDNRNGTAVIAGTPAADSGGRRYPATVTATNTSGTATRHFTIVVSQRRNAAAEADISQAYEGKATKQYPVNALGRRYLQRVHT